MYELLKQLANDGYLSTARWLELHGRVADALVQEENNEEFQEDLLQMNLALAYAGPKGLASAANRLIRYC